MEDDGGGDIFFVVWMWKFYYGCCGDVRVCFEYVFYFVW